MLVPLTINHLSLMHILESIPSEAQCRRIIRQSLFGKRIYCPRCLSSHVKRSEHRYTCPTCRKPFSIISASPFRHRRISYQQIFILLICWQKKVPFWTTAHFANVSPPTVRRYVTLFRTHLVYESPILRGSVEVDEAWLGRKKHKNQTIVIGATERKSGKAVLRIMKKRDQEWSDRFLLAYIEPQDSTIYSDGWEGYHGIREFFGYRHRTCIHGEGDFGPTAHAENIWSRLKRFITRTWDHSWKEHLPQILREFEARINAPELFNSPLNYLEICLTLVPKAC